MPSNISYTIRSDGPHVLRCSVERPAAWWAGPALALAAALPGLALVRRAQRDRVITPAYMS